MMVDFIIKWSEGTVAVIGAVSALVLVMKSLYKMARNIESLVDTSAKNAERLDRIEKQVIANGGSSLRDVVDRIEVRVRVLEQPVANTLR